MKKSAASPGQSASGLISNRIVELRDWRGKTLSRMRTLIKEADPDVLEEWKWATPTRPGTPVWSHDGIICTGESYKSVVKLTFARGAALKDPARLFNSSLDGNARRAIDIHEGQEVDEAAFKALVRQAVTLNSAGKSKRSEKRGPGIPSRSTSPQSDGITMTGKTSRKSGVAAKAARRVARKAVARKAARPRKAVVRSVVGKRARPKLLAGGNPQIAKAEGDAPVQAYIAAMPGWKRNVGRRLDALIVRTVPGVRKAVKWNSPFYGVEGQGWFLDFHTFTNYVKVAFFRGTSLRPVPPGESKHKEVRYLDIREGDQFEAQFAAWVKQASQLPGVRM